MSILKFLKSAVGHFGYEIVSRKELDRLSYKAMRRVQEKAPDPVSAMGMKKSLLHSNTTPIIFDIGAYVGDTVEQYMTEFPKATIHAFEPTESSFAELKSRYANSKAVRCNKFAVIDREGIAKFNTNEFSPTNSYLSTHEEADSYWGDNLLNTNNVVQIKTISIDSYCEKNEIDRINLLKIDVQGAELSVLNGAEHMLDKKNIDIIYLEVLYVPTYNNQSEYYEIEKFLQQKGYDLYGMFNLTYGNNRVKQADLLFYSS